MNPMSWCGLEYSWPQVRYPYLSLAMFTVYTCCFACFILYVSRLGLCPFSGLVCDLLLRRVQGYSPESASPEEYLSETM